MKRIGAFLVLSLIFHTYVYGQIEGRQKSDQLRKQIEEQLFPGAKLSDNFVYTFSNRFEERTIQTKDGTKLNALVFKADSSKGVIFYLHGSIGALNIWGKIANTYTALHYDLFMPDYRGYGKSEGKITSEEQLYDDVQEVYNYLKQFYPENKITVLGQSIGTGPAARLATNNHPKQLILQAPYYSIVDWIQNIVPAMDTSIISYKFNTYQFLQSMQTPVVIFHGDADKAIYYSSSQKLSAFFKPGDQLITLKGEGHNDFTKNAEYLKALKTIFK